MASSKPINERLEWIKRMNPGYAKDIEEFLRLNPIFEKVFKYVALSPEPEIPMELGTIEQFLIYYVCHSGVCTDYGTKLWTSINEGKDGVVPPEMKIPAGKQSTITAIKELCSKKASPWTISDIEKLEIKGVGPGAKAFVKQGYFHSKDVVMPTDRVFQKGMKKIYGLDTLTVSKATSLANKWKGHKYIGNMFCFQAAHYMSE